jgi:hypothetical protein
MSDDRRRPDDDSQPFDRPGPMLVLLWVAAAAMLLVVGLWLSG